jgi:hypothetical protein
MHLFKRNYNKLCSCYIFLIKVTLEYWALKCYWVRRTPHHRFSLPLVSHHLKRCIVSWCHDYSICTDNFHSPHKVVSQICITVFQSVTWIVNDNRPVTKRCILMVDQEWYRKKLCKDIRSIMSSINEEFDNTHDDDSIIGELIFLCYVAQQQDTSSKK